MRRWLAWALSYVRTAKAKADGLQALASNNSTSDSHRRSDSSSWFEINHCSGQGQQGRSDQRGRGPLKNGRVGSPTALSHAISVAWQQAASSKSKFNSPPRCSRSVFEATSGDDPPPPPTS